MAATLVDDAAIENVIAYIQTLPDVPSQATIVGNLDNGERLWKTCGACHGANGQGIEALNAPRLAGVNDWYLATQLKNFKAGIRGAHSQDAYGMQMRLMANILKTDQAVDDVVAYINTLPGAGAAQQLSMNARID
jgi:cytochrome c oxidase subunit 2